MDFDLTSLKFKKNLILILFVKFSFTVNDDFDKCQIMK